MKCVDRDKHILHVLKSSKCKLRKSILKSCDRKVIQTLSEIVHNVLTGNIKIDPKLFTELEKFKTKLKKIHKNLLQNKGIEKRRKIFVNQTGGFWAPLLGAALSALVEYGVRKFLPAEKAE